jgi:hypothetical protein
MRVAFLASLVGTACALFVTPARAQGVPVDEVITVEADGTIVVSRPGPSWEMDRFAMRLGFFQQTGRGYQSQAGPSRWGPGSEEALILNPVMYARIVQPDGVTHDVYLPVDIVTAASPDALDALTSASRDTETVDLDIYTRVPTSDDSAVTLHWGGHVEEQFRSVYLGTAVNYEMADDNAVLTLSFDGILDILDPVQPNGWDPGLDERFTGSLNVSLSQLLSPTTVVIGSYGATGQFGTIGTTWNSVPYEGGDRIPDLLPNHRLRHALALQLRQAIPDSRTFFMGSYRFYADDFGLFGHTIDAQVTQYLLPELSLRASSRFHTQTAVSFYTELLPITPSIDDTYRTSDSDLSAFDAHEVGATLRWYWDPRGAVTAHSSYFELSYFHYERTNGLTANVASLGWGWEL